jgi:type I restriction enzyme M protein
MTKQDEFTSSAVELSATLRGSVAPLLQLDIVRCLLFLRYVEPNSFGFGHDEEPLAIPEEASWPYLEQREHELAKTLARACVKLEEVNPALEGILTAVDFRQLEPWNDERRDRILGKLIASMSKLPSMVSIGDAYDSFVLGLAESSGKVGSELFLSIPLARLMVEILEPQDGMSVCDPVCRAGRTIVECARRAAEKNLRIVLYAQEPSNQLRGIARMDLLMRGIHDAKIEAGDVLHSPKFVNQGRLLQYDRIISAPPINRDNWGAEDAAKDRFGRFPVIPPKHNADYAYVLHCLSTLKRGGRAVILTGRGVLFRQGGEERIRRMLLQGDHLEAIVGLPGGLLYGTHIPAALIVLRKGEGPHSGRVLFVEVHRSDEPRTRNEAFTTNDIEAVADCVRRFEDAPGLARVVTLAEIEQNQWGLNPGVYIQREISHPNINLMDFAERIELVRRLEDERDKAAFRMDELIKNLTEQLAR